MQNLKRILYRTVLAGSCASVLSTFTLAYFGRREAHSAAAPINAVSHWYWGKEALSRQEVDVAHTVVGYTTHHIAASFWAVLLCAFLQRQPQLDTPARLVAASAATSAIACFVDFKLTPERLTPGYEHRVSTRALTYTYIAFAAGLAIGTIATALGRGHGPRRWF